MPYKKEWFNDDAFWERYAPIIFDETRMAETPAAVSGITRLAHLRDKGRILDLCCGIGRITLELARRGFAPTGVDIQESYLNKAAKTASSENLNIRFICKDARSFRRKNSFDAVINLYNSFGYFMNPLDDLLLLKNAYYSLREGGSLVIDVLGKEIAVRDYTESEWLERAGYYVLIENYPVDSWGSVMNRWILIKDGKCWEKNFIQRLYAASELRSLLFQAGFTSVELYGDWDETPYDEEARTLIAVGRKL